MTKDPAPHHAGARSRIGFFAAASSLVAIFADSASAIPLYELYRRADHLSHADLAMTAVAYFVAIIVALLVLGRLSDRLGRRPVALGRGAVAPFLVASAVAGFAQGAAFAGSMRALLATAGPLERAGLLSAIYLMSYSGAAVPNFIAGRLSDHMSLFHIALGYGALAAVACLITVGASRAPRPATA